jgi:hypothetical protein
MRLAMLDVTLQAGTLSEYPSKLVRSFDEKYLCVQLSAGERESTPWATRVCSSIIVIVMVDGFQFCAFEVEVGLF